MSEVPNENNIGQDGTNPIGQDGTSPNQNWSSVDEKHLNDLVKIETINVKEDIMNSIDTRFVQINEDIREIRKNLKDETTVRNNKDDKIRRDIGFLVLIFILSLIGCGINISHIMHWFGL